MEGLSGLVVVGTSLDSFEDPAPTGPTGAEDSEGEKKPRVRECGCSPSGVPALLSWEC